MSSQEIIERFPERSGIVDPISLMTIFRNLHLTAAFYRSLRSYYEIDRYVSIASVYLFLCMPKNPKRLYLIPDLDDILKYASVALRWSPLPFYCDDMDFNFRILKIFGGNWHYNCVNHHYSEECNIKRPGYLFRVALSLYEKVGELTARCESQQAEIEAQREYIEQLECSPDPGVKYLAARANFNSRASNIITSDIPH